MDQKHTPLPWSVGEQNGHCGISLNDPEGGQIATVYLGLVTSSVPRGKAHFALPENAESVANAALIVRACNSHEQLVAALIQARSDIKLYGELQFAATAAQIDAALAAAGAA